MTLIKIPTVVKFRDKNGNIRKFKATKIIRKPEKINFKKRTKKKPKPMLRKININVGSQDINIDKKRMKEILQEIGIKKINKMSECFMKCECYNFYKVKNCLNISFITSFNKKFFHIWFNRLTNLFDGSSLTYDIPGGYNHESRDININVIKCCENILKFSYVIKHEILHYINLDEQDNPKHCNNKNCFFNEKIEGNYKNYKFCKSCENKYQKFLEKVN